VDIFQSSVRKRTTSTRSFGIIPTISTSSNLKNLRHKHQKPDILKNYFLESNLDNTQMLEEVIIEASKREARLEELRRTSWGKIDLWDSKKRQRTPNLAAYLSKWYRVSRGQYGEMTISNYGFRDGSPTIFLNDIRLSGLNQLSTLPMSTIDYIELNRQGLGEGLFKAGGVIRVYTDPNLRILENGYDGITFQSYKPPLTFSDDKKFYMPIYSSYKSSFYKHYGVIDWLPINSLNQNKELFIKFKSVGVKSINLYIEGVTDDGTFISEVKTINID
jgi:hypothetical protein